MVLQRVITAQLLIMFIVKLTLITMLRSRKNCQCYLLMTIQKNLKYSKYLIIVLKEAQGALYSAVLKNKL